MRSGHMKSEVLLLLITVIIVHESRCYGLVADSLYTRLLENGYRKEVRPKCPDETAVNVVFDLALRQIIELNEPKQFLQTNVWLRVYWTDCRLTWNATELGLSSLILPSNSVWYPDVTLYDSSSDEGMTAAKDYRVIYTSAGRATHQIPIVLTSLCKIDTTYFPFDRQRCSLTFGMWAYNGLEVNITNRNPTGDMGAYKRHVEWRVVSLEATRDEDMFDNVPYPTVRYTLHVERKPLFFVLNLFFPCVLISTVAILGFLLPPDSGEKVNLAVTVLLSLAVFQLIILEMMPPNSETLPFISIYFATTMVLVGLSCFMTVIVLNIHFRGHRGWRVPRMAKSFVIDTLGRLLCVRNRNTKQKHFANDMLQGTRYEQRKNSTKTPNKVNSGENGETPLNHETNIFLKHFQTINAHLSDIVSHLCDTDSDKDIVQEWHQMALVLDRTFMALYGFMTCLVLFVFTGVFLSQ